MKMLFNTSIIFLFTFILLSAQTKEVDKVPTPLGGMKALQKNVVYPEDARKNGITGKVIVEATVDERGNVIKTKLLASVDPGLDGAAIKAIEMTKFIPAEKDNKKVKSNVTIPIMFRLNGDAKKTGK